MKLGENVEASVSGDVLTLTVDLSAKGVQSRSGKTRVIASTRGGENVGGPQGQSFVVNLNVYTKG